MGGRVHSLHFTLGPSPCMWPASPALQRGLRQPPTPSPETPAAGRVAGEGQATVLAKVWSAPPEARPGNSKAGSGGSPTAALTALPGSYPVGGRPLGGADRAHLVGKWQPCPQRETPRCRGQQGQWPPARHCGGTLTSELMEAPRPGPGRQHPLHIDGSERLVPCPRSYSSQAAQPGLGYTGARSDSHFILALPAHLLPSLENPGLKEAWPFAASESGSNEYC